MSPLFLRQNVLTLNLLGVFVLFFFVLDIVLNSKDFFLFYREFKCNVISIGNLKQPKISERNSNKPAECAISSRGQGVWSLSAVNVSASARTIWKLSGNQSPRRQYKYLFLYHIANTYLVNNTKFCWFYYMNKYVAIYILLCCT